MDEKEVAQITSQLNSILILTGRSYGITITNCQDCPLLGPVGAISEWNGTSQWCAPPAKTIQV